MEDLIVYAITMMTMGQILFCLPNIISQLRTAPTRAPLLVFLLANAVIALGPVTWLLTPDLAIQYIALIFPVWLIFAPAFWLYVEGLTSPTRWQLNKKHGLHFLPTFITVFLSLLILSLPTEQQTALFFEDQEVVGFHANLTALWLFLTMLFWLGQSSYYVVKIVKRLTTYHKQLKTLFANNEKQELHWIKFILGVICLTWLLAISNLISTLTKGTETFGFQMGSALLFILVWTIGHWGLKQKPGFDGRYPDNAVLSILDPDTSKSDPDTLEQDLAEKTQEDTTEETSKVTDAMKYQKSALSEAQAQRIATKITAAMEDEQLYLDPDLSLSKLAKHLIISPNYVSQTLNETMNTSFYDFVNHWRVQSAIPKILANKDSVLSIALEVGFNARSSFYNVFKKETGQTPTQYRKNHILTVSG